LPNSLYRNRFHILSYKSAILDFDMRVNEGY
jgi:hypothetical protein